MIKNNKLTLNINQNSLKEVEQINMNRIRYVGVYIHIPFCNSKCFYCNFNSYVINKNKKDKVYNDYLNALIKEIESYKTVLKDKIVNTIFIGGGTPSILPSGAIVKILNAIKENFIIDKNVEITMEINPNAFDENLASEWLNAGVNRVSVGLQTANQNILKSINRTHTVNDFINTMQTLKKVGFKSINADLIIGLPNQTLKDVKSTLKLVLKQNVTHISAYALILEDDSALKKIIDKNKLTLPSEETTVKMYNLVNRYLKRHKLFRYEISNFAKNGFECKHNLNCWNMFEYVGFGAGAHSYFNKSRYYNVLGIHEYIDNINKNNNAIEFKEHIDKQEEFEENVLLGLRLASGINLLELKQNYNIDLLNTKYEIINNYIKTGFLKIENNYLKTTNKGFYVANKLILDLVE